ncbi:hypothetical protein VZT92_016545 [Zoarces viviparus]|uniref:Uncharacterized protein n=1 Tax=Zoarces viviparus TaxID=48416 RepID=A0AAW1EUH0_ZOAVI
MWSRKVRQQHKPELLSEVGSEVLGQLVVVLQTGQQEATALEQHNRLKGLLLQVRQNQRHRLLGNGKGDSGVFMTSRAFYCL